ncbi:MAG TPA: hypothetical protein VFJ01_10220, partial [Oleiagrimonas sp.]|nr:hypothetical protein [Oleiagrimonas sp.]
EIYGLATLTPREAVERGGKGPKGGRQDAGHFPAGQDGPSGKPRSAERTRRAPDGGALSFGSFSLGKQRK